MPKTHQEVFQEISEQYDALWRTAARTAPESSENRDNPETIRKFMNAIHLSLRMEHNMSFNDFISEFRGMGGRLASAATLFEAQQKNIFTQITRSYEDLWRSAAAQAAKNPNDRNDPETMTYFLSSLNNLIMEEAEKRKITLSFHDFISTFEESGGRLASAAARFKQDRIEAAASRQRARDLGLLTTIRPPRSGGSSAAATRLPPAPPMGAAAAAGSIPPASGVDRASDYRGVLQSIRAEQDQIEIPRDVLLSAITCSKTGRIMQDPMILPTGESCDRSGLTAQERLTAIDNRALKGIIDNMKPGWDRGATETIALKAEALPFFTDIISQSTMMSNPTITPSGHTYDWDNIMQCTKKTQEYVVVERGGRRYRAPGQLVEDKNILVCPLSNQAFAPSALIPNRPLKMLTDAWNEAQQNKQSECATPRVRR